MNTQQTFHADAPIVIPVAPINHDHYHRWLNYTAVRRETDKAFLITYRPSVDVWVAKSLIRGWRVTDGQAQFFVHLKTMNRIINEWKEANQIAEV